MYISLALLRLCVPSCENMVLWRGHFNATGRETSVNLTINGGDGELGLSLCVSFRLLTQRVRSSAFAGSVWLNNVFLGTAFGKYVASHTLLKLGWRSDHIG